MPGFGDYEYALKFRGVIQDLVGKAIELERPKYQYATVASIDHSNNKCSVTFPGDTVQTVVAMGATHPNTIGQIVRVSGLAGDRHISDVMGTGLVYDGTHFHGLSRGNSQTLQSLTSNLGATPNNWDRIKLHFDSGWGNLADPAYASIGSRASVVAPGVIGDGGIMAGNLHIPWRGAIAPTDRGAYVRFASNVAASSYWDAGVIQNGTGDWTIAQGTVKTFSTNSLKTSVMANVTTDGYFEAHFEVRENSVSGKSPRIAFHHSGVVASQIALRADGDFNIVNNPGNGYEGIYAQFFTVLSSQRWKRNIVRASLGLSKVLQMRPVEFEYNYDPSPKRVSGFIAEEMVLIAPRAVKMDELGLPSGIDYAQLMPLIVNAIQDMSRDGKKGENRIDALDLAAPIQATRIAALESQIADLTARITRLEPTRLGVATFLAQATFGGEGQVVSVRQGIVNFNAQATFGSVAEVIIPPPVI